MMAGKKSSFPRIVDNLTPFGSPTIGNVPVLAGESAPPPRKRGRRPDAEKRSHAVETTSSRAVPSTAGSQESADILLPISRIRTIMKSSPDVVQIGHESLVIMTKATEIFIQHLAQESFQRRTTSREVEYRDLASFVQEEQGGTEFLHEIIPHKVKVRDLASLAMERGRNDPDGYDDEDEDYSG